MKNYQRGCDGEEGWACHQQHAPCVMHVVGLARNGVIEELDELRERDGRHPREGALTDPLTGSAAPNMMRLTRR